MKAPRIFTPHNALADRLHDPRGVNAHTATQAAHVAIQTRKPMAIEEVHRALTRLTQDLAAFRTGTEASFSFDLASIYAEANSVASLSAPFGMPRLGEAASSLCKLLTEERGARPEAIAVHIDAMLMLSKNDALGEALLPGLRRLSDVAPDTQSASSAS